MHRRFFADEAIGAKQGLIVVGDALHAFNALNAEAFAGHAPHQLGRFFKAGGHRIKAGAFRREPLFLPGEVGHGRTGQLS